MSTSGRTSVSRIIRGTYSVPTFGGARRVVRAHGNKLDEFPGDIRQVPDARPSPPPPREFWRLIRELIP